MTCALTNAHTHAHTYPEKLPAEHADIAHRMQLTEGPGLHRPLLATNTLHGDRVIDRDLEKVSPPSATWLPKAHNVIAPDSSGTQGSNAYTTAARHTMSSRLVYLERSDPMRTLPQD